MAARLPERLFHTAIIFSQIFMREGGLVGFAGVGHSKKHSLERGRQQKNKMRESGEGFGRKN